MCIFLQKGEMFQASSVHAAAPAHQLHGTELVGRAEQVSLG